MLFCSDESHPDAVVICPYDDNHKVARGRFQRHLVKCEKNFPEGYLEICPFNASHRLFKAAMDEHIQSCPMRRFMEPSQYQSSANSYVASRLVSETTSTIDFVEYWSEDESDTQSKTRVSTSIQTEIICNGRKESEDEEDDDEEDYSKPLRAPYGYSQMMMMEVTDSLEDDMVSVVSSMGMGRGRGGTTTRDKKLFQKIAMGRGKSVSYSNNM